MNHHPIFRKFRWVNPYRTDTMWVNSLGARQRIHFDAGLVPNYLPFVAEPKERAPDQASASAARSEAPTSVDSARAGDSFQSNGRVPSPLQIPEQPEPLPGLAPLEQEATSANFFPAVNEEYFEWIDVLSAVDGYVAGGNEHRPFVFVELGAGYGRWSVNAITALRQRAPSAKFRVIAAEADPQHFAWLAENFADNDIDVNQQVLVMAPVTGTGGIVHFHTGGDPATWYGQAVVADDYVRALVEQPEWQARNNAYVEASGDLARLKVSSEKRFIVPMQARRLSHLLGETPGLIDLIDMDIQGSEGEVIEESEQVLRERVLRLHVATHSLENEVQVKQTLLDAGWILTQEYPCLGSRPTPFGEVPFGDGVQSWTNRRFVDVLASG